jgi:hypothetical protein
MFTLFVLAAFTLLFLHRLKTKTKGIFKPWMDELRYASWWLVISFIVLWLIARIFLSSTAFLFGL